MVDELLPDGSDRVSVKIHNSTQISKQVGNIISQFSNSASGGGETQLLVLILTADAAVANKLISIVEISKRELLKIGHRVYQYNTVGQRAVTQWEPKSKTDEETVAGEDEAFEAVPQQPKQRIITTMTVFLCSSPIKTLREAYGYDPRLSLD